MTQFYGFDKELVDAAILFDAHFKNPNFQVMPGEGEFVIRDGQIFFNMELLENGDETLEFPVSTGEEVTLEDLNSENTCIYIVSVTLHNSSKYQLIVTCGEDEEEASESADQAVINTYIKIFKVTSKKKVEKLITQYFEEFPVFE